jgi:hypothetical protein
MCLGYPRLLRLTAVRRPVGSTYDSSPKVLSGSNELVVYTPLNKPEAVSKQLYFKRMTLERPSSDLKAADAQERRTLNSFPSTLVGSLNRSFDVYLINLNWNEGASDVFTHQRVEDVSEAFVKQIIAHFKLKVHGGALEARVRR